MIPRGCPCQSLTMIKLDCPEQESDDATPSSPKKRGAVNPWTDGMPKPIKNEVLNLSYSLLCHPCLEDMDILWGAIYELAKSNAAQFSSLPHVSNDWPLTAVLAFRRPVTHLISSSVQGQRQDQLRYSPEAQGYV